MDLPGVGYAQASRNLRSNWTNLLRSFSHERPTLRILFHLIDSRHGNVCIFMYVCMYVCMYVMCCRGGTLYSMCEVHDYSSYLY